MCIVISVFGPNGSRNNWPRSVAFVTWLPWGGTAATWGWNQCWAYMRGWMGVTNSIFNQIIGAYSWFGKWNITLIQYILGFLLQFGIRWHVLFANREKIRLQFVIQSHIYIYMDLIRYWVNPRPGPHIWGGGGNDTGFWKSHFPHLYYHKIPFPTFLHTHSPISHMFRHP